MRRVFPEFFGATTEQYQESLRRAREIITRRTTRRRDSISRNWEQMHDLPEELDNDLVEETIRDRATALRTLSYRESILYWILWNTGNDHLSPTENEDSYPQPLNADREEALFRAMERRTAFPEPDLAGPYAGMTKRERWQAHRDEGESWDPATGRWVTDWSDGLQWNAGFEIRDP